MSKRRKAGGSAFGLALVAVLLFGAFAASGAQASTWHIDGQSFSGEETVDWSGGPIEFTHPEWGTTISCGSVSGTTKIKESSKSSGTLTLSECAMPEVPYCTLKPVSLNFNGYLVDSGGQAYERYYVWGKWTVTGEACSLSEHPEVGGSIAAAVGAPDAVHSQRTFSSVAESATGAKGLEFYGQTWDASGEATATLSGENLGKDFGVGIAAPPEPEEWEPESPATWTINSEPFSGTEEVAFSEEPTSIEIERSSGGLRIECTGAYSWWAQIMGGDESEAVTFFDGCQIPSAPKCTVYIPELMMNGQIGKEGSDVFERIDVSGWWEMSGTGCPFTGSKTVSGSIGAYLNSTGLSVNKMFIGETTDSIVKATGMRVNGETWSVYTEIDTVPIGANYGEEFGVQ